MSEWQKVKIGDFLIKETQRFLDYNDSKTLEVYGVSNIDGITKTTHKKSFDLSKYIVIKAKYFSYNPYRINVGSIGLTPKNIEGLVSPAYVVFRTDENKLIPELLLNFLKSKDGLFEIKKHARGTVRQALRYEDLCNIEMIIPPIEKQIEIIKSEKKIRNKKQKLDKQIAFQQSQLTLLRQQILQDAISGKLTADWREENPNIEPASKLLEQIKAEKERLIKNKLLKKSGDIKNIKTLRNLSIPDSWTWIKADQIFFVTKLAGFEYTKYIHLKNQGEIPVIRAQNVRPMIIKKDSLKYIDLKTSNQLERCALIKPCLLVTFIGAGIGDVALFQEKERWHLAPNVAKMEPFQNCEEFLNLKFLIYFLFSSTGQKELFKHVKATAQPSLSMGTIRDIDFIFPPLAEQKVIVAKVEKLMSYVSALEEKIKQNQQNSEMLMQSFLSEAFRK